jgi:hypothetical protein
VARCSGTNSSMGVRKDASEEAWKVGEWVQDTSKQVGCSRCQQNVLLPHHWGYMPARIAASSTPGHLLHPS